MSTSDRQTSINDYYYSHKQSLLPLTFHTVPGRDSLHEQKLCSRLELGWLQKGNVHRLRRVPSVLFDEGFPHLRRSISVVDTQTESTMNPHKNNKY